jgi:hypothetical protein
MSDGPSHTGPSTPSAGLRHEPEGSSARGILLGALLFLVSLALILVCVRALLRYFRQVNPSRMPGNVPAQVTSSPVTPWVHPARDLAELRAREDEHLTTYAWLDREQRVVRIPIEQALQRLLEPHAAQTQPATDATQSGRDPP